MNQQASEANPKQEPKPAQKPVKEKDLELTDRDLMVTLIYLRLIGNISQTWKETTHKEGYRMIFIFERTEEILGAIERWRSPEPIPVNDIREVFMAERIFNSAVHDRF